MFKIASHSVDLTSALDTDAAAVYFFQEHGQRYAPATLTKWRSVGGGPAFFRVGRAVRYLQPHLDEYARSRISGPLIASREGRLASSPCNENEMPPGVLMSEGHEAARLNRNLANHGDGEDLVDLPRSCKAVAHTGNDGTNEFKFSASMTVTV